MSVHNSLVMSGVEKYASDYLKDKYLPVMVTGEKIGAFLLSEPEAGSDATSQKNLSIGYGRSLFAQRHQNWITSAGTASVYIVFGQTIPKSGTEASMFHC